MRTTITTLCLSLLLLNGCASMKNAHSFLTKDGEPAPVRQKAVAKVEPQKEKLGALDDPGFMTKFFIGSDEDRKPMSK